MKISCTLAAALPLIIAAAAHAQVEPIFNPIGMSNQFVFPHISLPGATGIDFSWGGGFAPFYGPEDSHTVVIVFEWAASETGPWLPINTSPDYVNTVPGGMTDTFSTGVFHSTVDAPWVAIHFYAGGLMSAAGPFTHTSVPTPGAAAILVPAYLMLARRRR